jgi:hypothetical protein
MQTIPIVCPKCRIAAAVPEAFAGRTVRCKHCKTRTFVPIPDEPAEVTKAKPSPTTSKPARRPVVYECPHCDTTITAPASSAGKDATCPACRKRTIVPDRRQPKRGWGYVVASAVVVAMMLAIASSVGGGRGGVAEPIRRDLAAWLAGGVTLSKWVVLPVVAYLVYRAVCVASPAVGRARRTVVPVLVVAALLVLLAFSTLLLMHERLPVRIIQVDATPRPGGATPTPTPAGIPHPDPAHPGPRPQAPRPGHPAPAQAASGASPNGGAGAKNAPPASPDMQEEQRRRERIATLVNELKNGTTDVKLAALRELEGYGHEAAEPLIRAAAEGTGEVRRAALESLEKAYHDLYRPVVTLIVDSNWDRRTSAVRELQKLGPKAEVAASLLLDLFSLIRSPGKQHVFANDGDREAFALQALPTLVDIAADRRDFHEVLLDAISDSGYGSDRRTALMGVLGRLMAKGAAIDRVEVVKTLIKVVDDDKDDYDHKRRVAAIRLLVLQR